MQSAADPDRDAHSSRLDAIQSHLSLFFWGLSAPVACSHWVDGVSWLRLLAKDRPDSGLLVAHWAENDAYPYLARSQSETLCDHIRCEIHTDTHTAWGMEFQTRPHAGKRKKSADNARAEGCRCRC